MLRMCIQFLILLFIMPCHGLSRLCNIRDAISRDSDEPLENVVGILASILKALIGLMFKECSNAFP
jgi:hypothetical protein